MSLTPRAPSCPLSTSTAQGRPDLGDLPAWDFSSLYASDDAPEIARDFDWLAQECARFAAEYEGKLAGLDADALLDCVTRYERLNRLPGG